MPCSTLRARMKVSIEVLGTGMKLPAGTHVYVYPATNLPKTVEGNHYYARPCQYYNAHPVPWPKSYWATALVREDEIELIGRKPISQSAGATNAK